MRISDWSSDVCSSDLVYLYRSDLARRAPRWLAALQGLSGRIDAQTMQRLNARVKLDRETGAQVAADWLGLDAPRSEEHTSELQSLMRISYAVFCLKKKKRSIV